MPYQALVIRESARLFRRVCLLGTEGVLGSRTCAAGVTPLTLVIVPHRPRGGPPAARVSSPAGGVDGKPQSRVGTT